MDQIGKCLKKSQPHIAPQQEKSWNRSQSNWDHLLWRRSRLRCTGSPKESGAESPENVRYPRCVLHPQLDALHCYCHLVNIIIYMNCFHVMVVYIYIIIGLYQGRCHKTESNIHSRDTIDSVFSYSYSTMVKCLKKSTCYAIAFQIKQHLKNVMKIFKTFIQTW